MARDKELEKDNIRETHWLGEVVDNVDPSLLGRCRVKVYGKFDLLENESIPWATPMNRDNAGAHSIPRVGDIVAVRFDNGNIYHPEYWFQINQNKDLKSEVLEQDPDNAHDVVSLVYDAERDIRIYSSTKDGLVISRGSGPKERPLIQIDEEGYIKISTDQKIFLDSGDIFLSNKGEEGADESEPAVRGVSLEKWLNEFLDEYERHWHPTGVGPSGIPAFPTPLFVGQLRTKHVDYQQTGK